MATIAYPGQLQNAQTGNADSTNTIIRGPGEVNLRAPILRIVSTIGATPTVTVNLLASNDGTNWYQCPYSPLNAIAGAYSVAAIVITTAVTGLYYLMAGQEWRYFKLNMSANTNVTLTTDLL